MSKKFQIILLFFLIASLIFTSFYIRDFRIDASSDSLVSQNDEDFKYFSYYQDLFPTKNSLVIAIKSNSKIDRVLIEEIEKISKKLSDLQEVYSVFTINKAPILLLNKTNLLDLANDNYETIIDTNLAIKDVLNRLHTFTGDTDYVFFSPRGREYQHVHRDSLNAHLKKMGYKGLIKV